MLLKSIVKLDSMFFKMILGALVQSFYLVSLYICKILKNIRLKPCVDYVISQYYYILYSIGSLGANNSEAYVSNVVVNKATLIGTTNGVRIKTWQVNLQHLD